MITEGANCLSGQINEQVEVPKEVLNVVVPKLFPLVGQGTKVLQLSLHGPVLHWKRILGHKKRRLWIDWS